MAKMAFDEIFRTLPDGSLEPKFRIHIGKTIFGPGVRFRPGVSFAGIDFSLFRGKDIEFELDKQQTDTGSILGIYQ